MIPKTLTKLFITERHTAHTFQPSASADEHAERPVLVVPDTAPAAAVVVREAGGEQRIGHKHLVVLEF